MSEIIDINVNYSIKLKLEKKNWVAKNDNDGIDINKIIEKCDDMMMIILIVLKNATVTKLRK